jgi:ABC-type nitrate/sulfonate/bicarbonate transport system substrate-binding protein
MNTPSSSLPEKSHLRVGFVALSDAAPVVVAKILEFGHAHGLTLELCKQPSWAAIRDKLLSGEIDAAHSLYGLVYGVQLGIGGPQADMAVLMVLNRNGQAVTLATGLADTLARDETRDLKKALATLGRAPVFAQTFPTGTHAMWLYYWLAAQGVHPLQDIRSVVVPPPLMAGALAAGELDGFCVGEPWNALAEASGVGRTVAVSSEIWPDHPEKVLACRRDFVERYPNTARALIQTLLEACQWLDNTGHREEISRRLAEPDLLDVSRDVIASRLQEQDGVRGAPPVSFHDEGRVNYPRVSDGVWFITQFRRWGMLGGDPMHDHAIAAAINQTDLYSEAAKLGEVSLPDEKRNERLCDGVEWKGDDSSGYLAKFSIHA